MSTLEQKFRVAEQIVDGDWVAVTHSIHWPDWEHVFAVWLRRQRLTTSVRVVARAWATWRRAQLTRYRRWRFDPNTVARFPHSYLFNTSRRVTATIGNPRRVFQSEITNAHEDWTESRAMVDRAGDNRTAAG